VPPRQRAIPATAALLVHRFFLPFDFLKSALADHLLNVSALGMSAYADDAEHFFRWLIGRDLATPDNPRIMTAIIALEDHPLGTDYVAHVMHKNNADRNKHEEMGFYDGWGTVTEQLANLAERQV
jgi:hypothetical protein